MRFNETVLLMFPVVVPVLKNITPFVALVVAPSTIVFVTVLFDASLINRTVAPVVLVLRNVRSPVTPAIKPIDRDISAAIKVDERHGA